MELAPLAIQPAAPDPALRLTTGRLGGREDGMRAGLHLGAAAANEHGSPFSQHFLESETEAASDLPGIVLPDVPVAQEGFSTAWASALHLMKSQAAASGEMDAASLAFLAEKRAPATGPFAFTQSAQSPERAQQAASQGEISGSIAQSAAVPNVGSTLYPFARALDIAAHGGGAGEGDIAHAETPLAPDSTRDALAGQAASATARQSGLSVHGAQTKNIELPHAGQGVGAAFTQIDLADTKNPSATISDGTADETVPLREATPKTMGKAGHSLAGTSELGTLAAGAKRTSGNLPEHPPDLANIFGADSELQSETTLQGALEAPRTPVEGFVYTQPASNPAETFGSPSRAETASPANSVPREPASPVAAGLEHTFAGTNGMRRGTPLPDAGVEAGAFNGQTAFEVAIRPKSADAGGARLAPNGEARETARSPVTMPNPLAENLRNSNAAGNTATSAETASDVPAARAEGTQLSRTAAYVADLPGSPNAPANVTPRPSTQGPVQATAQLDAGDTETTPSHLRPAGDVTVQLRSEGRGTASIRFSERAGEVQVTVRSADPQLVQSLRTGLDHLKSGLETQGFQAAVWSANSPSQSLKASADSSLDTYQSTDEDQAPQEAPTQDHSRRRGHQTEEWMDEID